MKTVSTKLYGYTIEGYQNDYVFETIKETNNFYEVHILDRWTEKIKNAKIIFDIGGNIGNHTLYWAKNLNYKFIYTFEPYKPTFERLKNNIVNNNLENILCVNKGVGSVKGFANTSFVDETNMGSTTIQYSENINENSMEVVDIDSFTKENNINNIDFIKIDVESFELLVLSGMKSTLNKMKPDLWIEVGTDTYSKIIDDLKLLDYVPVDIEGFNILFLNNKRHSNLVEYDKNKILNNMFVYLEKTNTYYRNYLKAKQWVKDKNESIEKANMSYRKLKEKYEISNRNYKKEKEELSNIVENFINDFEDEIIMLKENKALIHKLETQNNYLKHENNEYRRKLSLITDTFIGKIGIKIYKKLKKLKAKIK